jgi:hypothetical protein
MKEGQRIREKHSNETGTIISVHPDHILVQWDSGLQDMVRNEYVRKYILKLEESLETAC